MPPSLRRWRTCQIRPPRCALLCARSREQSKRVVHVHTVTRKGRARTHARASDQARFESRRVGVCALDAAVFHEHKAKERRDSRHARQDERLAAFHI